MVLDGQRCSKSLSGPEDTTPDETEKPKPSLDRLNHRDRLGEQRGWSLRRTH